MRNSRGKWQRNNIYKILKEKSWQPGILLLGKISFKNEDKIKIKTTNLTDKKINKNLSPRDPCYNK